MSNHKETDVALVRPDESRMSVAGESSSGQTVDNGDRKRQVMRLATGGLLAAGSLLLATDVEQAVAQEDQDETPTPRQNHTDRPLGLVFGSAATPTPSPDQVVTPTPGETLVAQANIDASRFVLPAELNRYPETFRFTNWFYQHETEVRINRERVAQLLTVNGTPLPLGVYDEAHPLPIDPRAFEGFQEWSGGDLRPMYVVGILAEVQGFQDQNPTPTQGYANPDIVVAIPLPGSNDFFPVMIGMVTVGGRFCALDQRGQLVPLPANLLDNMGRIPYQLNGQNYINYSNQEGWISFPTSQGNSIVRVGDPIIVRFVTNLDVYNDSFRGGLIGGSGGRTPEQVVADLYDNIRGNEGHWLQYSSALATVYTPHE